MDLHRIIGVLFEKYINASLMLNPLPVAFKFCACVQNYAPGLQIGEQLRYTVFFQEDLLYISVLQK